MNETVTYRPLSSKAFVESATARYESEQHKYSHENELERINKQRRIQETSDIINKSLNKSRSITRRNNFSENVRNTLLSEAIYKIFSEAVDERLRNDPASRTVMRGIVSNFLMENDSAVLLRKMKSGSTMLSEMYNVITEHVKNILESDEVSKDNMLVITDDMKDSFFDSLDHTSMEDISDQIRDRVTDAVSEFIDTNAKDHEEIKAALEDAQAKIDKTPSTGDDEKDEEIRESFNRIAKGKISAIRNRRKNVFHNMVTAMGEQVIKDSSLHAEFMKEGKIDMDKIVDRVTLMYTFMETVNSTRLVHMDENYIAETIKGLRS